MPKLTELKKRVVKPIAMGRPSNISAEVWGRLAWAYTKYLTDPQIKVIEEEARAARIGLWHDDKSVPPWDWRRTKRTVEDVLYVRKRPSTQYPKARGVAFREVCPVCRPAPSTVPLPTPAP